MARLRIGSLFSGIGGLELGVERATGGQTVWNCEMDPFCRKVLAKHWPDATQYEDVKNIDATVAPVDIITGGFPCFPAGTLITTSKGLVPIEKIGDGDRVLTHERRWRKVVTTMTRDRAPLWEVTAMGAPPVRTTSEHPFYARLKRRRWDNDRRRYERVWDEPEWVDAKDLTKDHFLAQPVDVPSSRPGKWLTPEVAYVVGRWLGDGWIADYKRKSKIVGRRGSRVNSQTWKAIICGDFDEADEIAARIDAAGYHATPAPDRTTMKFHISSKALVQALEPFGRGAAGKQLPWAVMGASLKIIEALWDGWTDADGEHGVRLRGTSVSRRLIMGMAHVARRVHGRAPSVYLNDVLPTTVIEGRTVNQKPWYQLALSERNREAFVEDGFAWVPVRQVRALGRRARVYNFEVEEDNSYVADSFVVHNCQDLSIAGKQAGLSGDRSGLWHEYARIIRELQPRFVFVENVPALRSFISDGGLGRVLGDLAESGYDAEWDCVPAAAIGAPHVRDRIFILAWRRALADAADGRGEAQPAVADGGALLRPGAGAGDGIGDGADPAGVRVAGGGGEERERGEVLAAGLDHPFPPPPGSPDWAAYLDRHPEAQPGIRRDHDGVPRGLDKNRRKRLKALGNAVVPQAATRAWQILIERSGVSV